MKYQINAFIPFPGINKGRASYRRLIHLFLIILLHLIFLTGCTGSNTEKTSALKEDSAQESVADLYPEKVTIKYAKRFNVHYFNTYKVITVFNPYENKADTLTYLLLGRNAEIPKGYEHSQIVRIPVQRMALFSTTHVGLIEMLGAEDMIAGISDPKYLHSRKIHEMMKQGKTIEVGLVFNPNLEALLAINPDLLMISVLSASQLLKFQALMKANIPIIVNADWLESSPLGRAEWVKMMAALLDKEAEANKKFSEIEASYEALSDLTKNVKNRPSVLLGLPYKDSWFMSAGKSYMVQLLKDAGASYHWESDSATGGLKLNFEKVYPVALEAEYWLNQGKVDSREELLSKDPRFADFKAFKNGNLYNNTKLLNEHEGNAYWEIGITNPHIVLADLIKIFHPELSDSSVLKAHPMTFYKKID
ncbi:MAG: ABC transporter substrate-binding protein [Chlorobiales bacterium]|jgi:iron complex transport system substrate-binding protein|nr:ABC transporter substrate-binding protein [Chlorobiales bacterium]